MRLMAGGTCPFSPCQASRGHSISLTESVFGIWLSALSQNQQFLFCTESRLQHSYFELPNVRIQGRGLERLRNGLASFHGINNLVNPQASRAVAWVGLL